MSRLFPPSNTQLQSQRLRNEICRLASPIQMAEVSSHLRNFAVAEVIGFIALLDGHPRIAASPSVQKGPAAFQQTRGTTPNPLAHAVPSNLLLNGDSLVRFYRSEDGRIALERVFGMGVMAPDNWESNIAFQQAPRQNNVVDTIVERHHYGDGLVEAFKACGELAVSKGTWDASGKRKHDFGSLSKFISDIYGSTWVPRARATYLAGRSHFANQIASARRSNPSRVGIFEQRRGILEAQLGVLEKEVSISPEAAKNVWKFTAKESWA